MRNYALVSPVFWVGSTGRELRKVGADAQVLALYLITSPTSQMYGLYYLPKVLMSQETGIKDARTADLLSAFEGLRYAYYDEAHEFVWVVEMARWQLQLDQPLKSGDRRVAHANHWYRSLPKNAYLGPFYDRYHYLLNLNERREMDEGAATVDIAPTPERVETVLVPIKASHSELFERWWAHYPKKVGKKAAFAEWLKIRPTPDETFVDHAIEVVERQRRSADWIKDNGQFIPDPERWLKKGRWQDEAIVTPRLTEKEAGTARTLLDWAQRGRESEQPPVVNPQRLSR